MCTSPKQTDGLVKAGAKDKKNNIYYKIFCAVLL